MHACMDETCLFVSVKKTSQLRDQIKVAVQYTRVNKDEREEGRQQIRGSSQVVLETQQWWN